MDRRTFLGAGAAGLSAQQGQSRVAIVGTGHRGSGTWGVELLKRVPGRVSIVALCDINPKRLQAAKRRIGVDCPTYANLEQILKEAKPDLLIVTTRDGVHHEQIIKAMEMGFDVLTEKPMTTDEAKCQAIIDTEKRTGRKVRVAFNYRYSNTAQKIKELLMSGAIGAVTSVDFQTNNHRSWHPSGYWRVKGSPDGPAT